MKHCPETNQKIKFFPYMFRVIADGIRESRTMIYVVAKFYFSRECTQESRSLRRAFKKMDSWTVGILEVESFIE